MDAASFDTPEAEIAALRALPAKRDAELRNASFEIEKLKVQLAGHRRRLQQLGQSPSSSLPGLADRN